MWFPNVPLITLLVTLVVISILLLVFPRIQNPHILLAIFLAVIMLGVGAFFASTLSDHGQQNEQGPVPVPTPRSSARATLYDGGVLVEPKAMPVVVETRVGTPTPTPILPRRGSRSPSAPMLGKASTFQDQLRRSRQERGDSLIRGHQDDAATYERVYEHRADVPNEAVVGATGGPTIVNEDEDPMRIIETQRQEHEFDEAFLKPALDADRRNTLIEDGERLRTTSEYDRALQTRTRGWI